MTVLFVAIGAALGAPARYLTDRLLQGRHNSLFSRRVQTNPPDPPALVSPGREAPSGPPRPGGPRSSLPLAAVFPWGTFAANVTGCALLGFLAALPAGSGLMAFAGTGFCGALTTYSTFGYETVRLTQSGARTLAVLNVGASILAGLGAAYCGMAVAQALTR